MHGEQTGTLLRKYSHCLFPFEVEICCKVRIYAFYYSLQKNRNSIVAGRERIVELLIEKGANVNAKDGFENSPLFEATKNGMHDFWNIRSV